MSKLKKRNLQIKLVVLVALIAIGVYFSVGNQRAANAPAEVAPVEVSDDSLAEFGFESPTKAKNGQKNGPGSESGTTTPMGHSTPAPYLLSAAAKTVILDCAKQSPTFRTVSSSDYFNTLDEYLQQAVAHHDKPSIQLQFRNIHALNERGEKRRLHVARTGGENSAAKPAEMEIQLFGVDEDDLPIPLDLPADYQTLSWSQKVEKFQAETHGQSLDESQNSYRWTSGASSQVTERNGQIEEIQIYFENKGFLGCGVREGREMDCQCL